MAISEPATVIEYERGQDPKLVVFEKINPLISGLHLFRNEVLLATAPNCTKIGSIFTPEVHKAEQRFQGKVGLIVALGELAFNDDALWPVPETRPVVGSWVMFRTADTSECAIGGYSCRFIDDDKVRGMVPAPDSIR